MYRKEQRDVVANESCISDESCESYVGNGVPSNVGWQLMPTVVDKVSVVIQELDVAVGRYIFTRRSW
jgi:hypothetical protein